MLCSVDVFMKSSVGEGSCYPACMHRCIYLFIYFIAQRTSMPKIRSGNTSHQDQIHVHVVTYSPPL